ncbi:MAG: nitrogenase iron-molybdenum cofactor biosynthesis protein NifN [Acidithiobacillus ferrivorans]
MSTVIQNRKACTVNPLKMSQPIGGALAFMGIADCMPMLHGSQGCTAFGLVLFQRHFNEGIPMQTTAMSEVATVMGGLDNIGIAILSIQQRTKPAIIGICSTGVTETKGDDVDGYLKNFRASHPELDQLALVYVSTPDFKDAFQDGWAKAVESMVKGLAEPSSARREGSVNFLVGSHLTAADIEELREISESFGLEATILPDISGSMDGHIPDDFTPNTLGGTPVDAIRRMGEAELTIALGEQMRPGAEALMTKTGQPYVLFDRITGIEATDQLLDCLSQLSGQPVPGKYRRQRSQLIDAMLDSHFFFGGKKIAIGAEPDLLWNIGSWFNEMGAIITAAVTTTHSPLLEQMPCEEVLIGDLEDLEARSAGCDLLITHSHGRQAAARLDIAFLRMGLPIFDQLGAAHRLSLGYRGARDLTFEIGNLLMAQEEENRPDSWPLPMEDHDAHAPFAFG